MPDNTDRDLAKLFSYLYRKFDRRYKTYTSGRWDRTRDRASGACQAYADALSKLKQLIDKRRQC